MTPTVLGGHSSLETIPPVHVRMLLRLSSHRPYRRRLQIPARAQEHV